MDVYSPLRELVRDEPVSVSDRMTLRSLAAVLDALGVGVALVREPEGPTGIVSERDVIRALAGDADPDVVWTPDVMTEQVVTADAGTRIVDAALQMVDEDLRHLVVTEDGEIIGVVSIRDVFRVITEEIVEPS